MKPLMSSPRVLAALALLPFLGRNIAMLLGHEVWCEQTFPTKTSTETNFSLCHQTSTCTAVIKSQIKTDKCTRCGNVVSEKWTVLQPCPHHHPPATAE
ncbi:hypothetical protein PCANC_12051 [Puccinia coronata f. sp. avenae]|uniref:Secreted protein n=1 Tax=Puccinia coronata f. sp. avenae TaxID=200324 RepID=A0A2N5T3P6_9BASI|nr:hypothetical protein PCASD_20119 [Puccinia coronata f. sp. avenae]PLW20084.1 hypothetical protein PCANC_12051 [Puccinia coronata f. sp. avenae]